MRRMFVDLYIEKVGVAAVDLGDRRAVVTSVDVQATEGLTGKYYCVCMLQRLM